MPGPGWILTRATKRIKMIDMSMMFHVISTLDTLEQLIPGEEAREYALRKWEWEAMKKDS